MAETQREVAEKCCLASKRVIREGAGEFRAMPETFQRTLTMEGLSLKIQENFMSVGRAAPWS